MIRKLLITALSVCFIYCSASGQEGVAPLDRNPVLKGSKPLVPKKTTALSLPFFDDFTTYGVFPDDTKWMDHYVYVNNTMAVQQITRGVATFDGLNAKGGPYDSVNNTSLIYADSLTSQPIDLSVHVAGDSIYLSFFYQPQGNGFSPEPTDSLMLYMKKTSGWVKVWGKEGSPLQQFRQVMIPVAEAAYFHNDFQFRFVNKVSVNINDDHWNIDYVEMATGRSILDTSISDIATSRNPTFLLNDYTSMPYRHFTANSAAELATNHSYFVRNNFGTPATVQSGYVAREATTNTPQFSSSVSNVAVTGFTEQQLQLPMYNINYNAPGQYDRVVLEQKYFATSPVGTDPKENDTIIHNQVFDNYLAYDDGTAEKSYFLNQSATLPALTAIEFHLNQPDTIRGVAIYFGRQVPLASNKFFSVAVYKDIAVNGGSDNLVYQQDLLFPSYADTVNNFWIYKFDTPVAMTAGTFFMGTIQPAASGSDSLYFGLDENRAGGNHLYVNYLNVWQPSIVGGALMIRPLLGQPIIASAVEEVGRDEQVWSIYPNPATTSLTIATEGNRLISYQIADVQGRVVLSRSGVKPGHIDISSLHPGIYFVCILDGDKPSSPKKIIKL